MPDRSVRPSPTRWRRGSRTPAWPPWSSGSSTRRRSCASKTVPVAPVRQRRGLRCRALDAVQRRDVRTTSSRCCPATSTGRAATCGCDPIRAATVPLAAMPGWAWAPVDQFTQDGEPYPGVPAHVRAAHGRGVRRSEGCRCRRRSSSSSRSARGDDDGGFEPAHEGPGLQRHRARRATTTFALELHHDDGGAGPRPAAVPPRVRRRPVRDVDRAARAGRGRRRRDGGSPDGAGGRPPARARCVSFAPQVGADTGNGTHLHLSLWDGERNLLAGGEGPAGHAGARARRSWPGILRRAAGARRRRRCRARVELPAAAAAPLVGGDAVLGHREP